VPEFHTFTLAAAIEVLEDEYDTHDRLDTLVFGWGCLDYIGGSTIKRKLLDLARAAEELNLTARTSLGTSDQRLWLRQDGRVTGCATRIPASVDSFCALRAA